MGCGGIMFSSCLSVSACGTRVEAFSNRLAVDFQFIFFNFCFTGGTFELFHTIVRYNVKLCRLRNAARFSFWTHVVLPTASVHVNNVTLSLWRIVTSRLSNAASMALTAHAQLPDFRHAWHPAASKSKIMGYIDGQIVAG